MSDLLSSKVDARVLENVSELAGRFATARPFRHVSIDGFFTEQTVNELATAFPAFDEKLAMNENGEVGGKAVHEKVRSLGKPYRELDDLVKGEEFRQLISRITGVPDLRYDPYYFGGGTHENLHGQSLDAHVDFNFHPVTRQHRRLNMIFYLTEQWDDAWGGSIQLHRDPYLPPSQDEIVVVTPVFNRCVIFETNEYSWHGFPRINLPEEKRQLSRRSFALYYYTDTRPGEELGPEHSTIYVEQHLPEDWRGDITLTAAQMQHIRNLVASRDQHLKRLYGNVKQLYTELNHLKEAHGLQPPPGVAPEPPEPAVAEPAPVVPEPAVAAAEPVSEAQEQQIEAVKEPAGPSLEELEEQWQARLHEREAQVQRSDAALARREAELARLRRRVEELEQSTSWRVTRPLRGLKRMFTRS